MKSIMLNRKGATLAELMVVLVVISIISFVVVSFTVTVSNKAKNSRSFAAALSEVQMVEAVVEGWIEQNSVESFSVQDETILSITKDETNIKFVYNTILETTKKDGNVETKNLCYTETIQSITFDMESKEGDYIIFCYVTYEVVLTNETKETLTHTFTINPRVGDSITRGGQSNGS